MAAPTDDSREFHFTSPPQDEVPEYRPLCGLAVLGLILGLLSALAILHIGFGVVGAAAVLVAGVAMAQIARTPGMAGRGLAIAGAVLAVFWTTAGWAKDMTHARLMDTESREFGLLWFDFLRKNEPVKAMELGGHPSGRRPLNARLIDHYLTSRESYESLQGFVGQPEVRSLLKLGDRATVRFYQCEGVADDRVNQVYAVTYEEGGVKKTFFVRLSIRRAILADKHLAGWYVDSSRGPIVPEALGGADAA